MNRQFGSWNPRGTSNSDYGRFFCDTNWVGNAPPGRNFGGENWVPDISRQDQHHPGYYNYGQDQHGQGQGQQQYQHQPGCHNYQAPGQGKPQEDRPFDVFVGEEAATAALGGKEQFEKNFPDYVKNAAQYSQGAPPQSQAYLDTGSEAGDENRGGGQMTMNNMNSNQILMAAQAPERNQIQEGEERCETQPGAAEGSSGDGGQPGSGQAQMTGNPCTMPTKWRGLTPNIQYGRHIRPLYARQNAQKQQQPPTCLTDAQLQEEIGMMVPGSGGGDDNSMQKPMPKPKKRVPVPATPKYMSNMAAPTTSMPAGAGKPSTLKKTTRSRGEVALCGKCPKCKDYLPPVVGPPIMTFSKSTAASLQKQKPDLRQMHTMGRQDAKNFRAVRYSHHTSKI